MTWEQKFGQGATQLRSLEDEGFFVGKKPIVPKKLIQRAEQRIIQEHEYEKKVSIESFYTLIFLIDSNNFSRLIIGSDPMEVLLHFRIQPNSFQLVH